MNAIRKKVRVKKEKGYPEGGIKSCATKIGWLTFLKRYLYPFFSSSFLSSSFSSSYSFSSFSSSSSSSSLSFSSFFPPFFCLQLYHILSGIQHQHNHDLICSTMTLKLGRTKILYLPISCLVLATPTPYFSKVSFTVFIDSSYLTASPR